MSLDDVLGRFPDARRNGRGWAATCPAHDDQRPSVSISTGADGRVLLYCHAGCTLDAILDAVHLEKQDLFPAKNPTTTTKKAIVACYDYADEHGAVLYQAVRYDPKGFGQRRSDGNGGWIWNVNGTRRVLFGLPELRGHTVVHVVEGEKDVLALRGIGLVATTNAGGAGKWRGDFAAQLTAAGVQQVVALPDNDDAGRQHAESVARSCDAVGLKVQIIALPDLPPKGDVSDWLDAGHTRDELIAIAEAAPVWSDSNDVAKGHEWPKPEPIQSELPPVEPLSEDLLPVSLRPLITDVAERMQVPIDYPAIAVLLCLAGVVNRRAIIQPKAQDTGWVVVPNLWGAIIAPPGFMKSPVLQAAIRPLNLIQSEWRREYDAALKNYVRAKEEYELKLAAWKEEFKKSTKKKTLAPDRPDDEPQEPTLRRLIVNDATFEALHQTMSDNPAGILVVRDELTGWWSQLERAGREGERSFCLEAWNGDTGHTMDRIGRGSIHVDACCMSMMGGIQPGRLRSYLVDALKDGPSNDGLIQRFQLLVWPATTPAWNYIDRAPDTSAEEQAARIFRNLVELDAENPARFRFSPDAQSLVVDYLSDLEARIRSDELHPAFAGHLSKYRSLMPALALLLELADRASCVGFDGSTLAHSPNDVSLEHAQQAAALCEYLESHAQKVYSCVVNPQLRSARELAEKIKRRKVPAIFSCREVYLKGWSGLDSPEAVKAAADLLQDAGWLRDVSTQSGPSGGRPSSRFEVNPRVWE